MQLLQCRSSGFRFIATGAILSLIITTFLIFSTQYSNDVAKYALKSSLKTAPQTCLNTSPSEASNGTTWEFVVERDGDNHGLSDEQCRLAFPKLFVELDKSASLREGHRITFKELDSLQVEDGMVRGIVHHGEVCWNLNHLRWLMCLLTTT